MSRQDTDLTVFVLFGRAVILTSVLASLLWELAPRLRDQPRPPLFALWAHPGSHCAFFVFGFLFTVCVIAWMC